MRKAVSAAVLAIAALVLVGCGGTKAANGNDSPLGAVHVHFTLNDPMSAYQGCDGLDGYSDIGSGTPVTLKDQTGTIIAASTLGDPVNLSPCRWTVYLEHVPIDRQFYTVEVGTRGGITKSLSELEGNSYWFDVTLG